MIFFLIKKQKYLSNNFQFHLFSAKIIAKQQEAFESISAMASKISASAARLLGCFSMSVRGLEVYLRKFINLDYEIWTRE